MLRLVVDTSIQGAVLGIVDIDNKKILWSLSVLDNRISSTLLSSSLKKGLDSISKDVSDIEEIVVSAGPGSFTGIKVGIAFCYGIVAGLKCKKDSIKLQGVSSLQLIYKSMNLEYGDNGILLLPSTKNQGFIVKGEEISNFDISKKECLEILESLSQKERVILVEEWKTLEEFLKEKGIKIDLIRIDIKKVHDISLKELSFVEIVNKKGQNQYSVVEPLYCREPSVFGR